MHTYARPQVDEVVREITQCDLPLIVAVTGPRQTGKTTMIKQALERVDLPTRYLGVDRVFADPSDPRLRKGKRGRRAWLLNVWRRARHDAERHDRGLVLVLDEIQYIPGWSPIVKGLWDQDRDTGCPLRIVLAGSAPWSMLTGLRESLAGRFMPVKVGHWSFPEMVGAFGFNLEQYLFFGGYPGPARLVKDVNRWRSYVSDTIISPAVERDIIALTRIEKPALMRRLMDLAADYSGQILSFNKMLGQLQEAGNATTLAEYLDLLSQASLVVGLPRYSGARYVARGSSPKLNVLNTALMTARLTRSFDEVRADHTMWGRLVESAVGAHLHNTAGHTADLYHWREAMHEFDFVLSRGLGPVGIEVKSGAGAGKRHAREAFRNRFPGARTLLVGKRGIPLDEFLSKPARYWADYDGPSQPGAGSRKRTCGEDRTRPAREPTARYAGKATTETWTQPLVPGSKHSGDPVAEDRQRKFMAELRKRIAQIARGEGPPWLWDRIGCAYMCAIPGHFDDEPVASLRTQVEADERLLAAALRGLPHFVRRIEIPSLHEMARQDATLEGDFHAYPILASLAETARQGGDPLRHLGDAGITRAVGASHLARYVKEPTWYSQALELHPRLCAEALITVYRSLIRRRAECDGPLLALSDDDRYAEVARLAVPTLLGVFPTRCTKTQIAALHALLWAALLHAPTAELAQRIERRAAARNMDAAQRALWLAAGLFTNARRYGPELVIFVLTGREPRANRILGFLVPERPRRRDLPEPWDDWETPDIVALFKAFARWNDPWWGGQRSRYDATTQSLRTDWLLKRWLAIVADRIEEEGEESLSSLSRLPALDRWFDEIDELRQRHVIPA
ncbi:MAG: ATP-binding protein [Gemmatimonadota bacterium]|nr:ATP-binding protein [Gemmatimonadota bacterium]MDE2864281.1 ATP-binding protein [Gemmatimonadota bacterium]